MGRHPINRLAAVCLLALLAASVCACPNRGDKDDAETGRPAGRNLTEIPGETVVAGALPPDWPADELPAYPDAVIIEGRQREIDGGLSMGVDLTSPDDGQKIIDFYTAKTNDAGFTVISNSQVESKWLSVYQRLGESFAVTVEMHKQVAEIELSLVTEPVDEVEEGQSEDKDQPADETGEKDDVDGESDKDKDDNPEEQPKRERSMVPTYPGSNDQGASLSNGMVSRNMTTADSPEQVQAWYRTFYNNLGMSEATTFNMQTQVSTTYEGPDGSATVVTGEQMTQGSEPALTMVFVSFTPAAPEI